MHDHSHAHPHPGDSRSAAPRLRLSWLRHSAAQRLAMASGAVVLLWGAVFWALQ